MKNKLVELVNIWASYETENPDLSLEDFCVRYLAEHAQAPAHNAENRGIPLNGYLAALIGRLNKYAGLYCKKAIENFGLRNIDDWVYLIGLQRMGTPKKSELIYEMLSEFPSGIDIIKRLLALELAEEFPDEQDKRSKRLKITPKGMDVLMQSMPYMERVGSMAFDTMNESEKIMVLNILKRLDNYHAGHYKAVRSSEFEEAYQILTPAK
ncbi:MAG: MarR family winged helix-turn-helix transcriptional regulator [Microscillaceae bacterium]|jgi:DNA-binding MarR family transcriptional regulator|nr:MarR family winged helix-turn-helix transcriptional regulator [Microscillaceae bacterium]